MSKPYWDTLPPSERKKIYAHIAPNSTVDYSATEWEQLPESIRVALLPVIRNRLGVTLVVHDTADRMISKYGENKVLDAVVERRGHHSPDTTGYRTWTDILEAVKVKIAR